MVYYLYAIYHSLRDSTSARELVEKGFLKCEMPLMIIAFVFDSKYIFIVELFLKWQEKNDLLFKIGYLAQAAQAYYVKVSVVLC